MYTLLKQEGRARRGEFKTVHGTVQTPAFMNVGTSAAIKGGISSYDLKDLRCQVELCNTYHLHLRPGDEKIKALGGLHKFMGWDGPILTDSGGFQVFSLAQLRTISEQGVKFQSHIDGRRIFMGPEESMRIQSNLASTIAMAFDECIENPATREYTKRSIDRTVRWLTRCRAEMDRLNAAEGTINPHQMLFGINQGSTFPDLRIEHMKQISEINCDGYAIGGLAVGEPAPVMYEIIEEVEPYMPKDKPRYLMGVGTPVNIIEAWTCSTVLCQAEMHATAICLPGRVSSTSTMQNMSWMTARLMQSVTVRFVSAIRAHISVICSKQMKCWACALLLCTTCISIIP